MPKSEAIQSCQLVGERILLRQKDPEVVSAGGIVIPEVAASRVNQGTVILSNVEEIPTNREVLFSPFGGIPVTIGQVQYLVLDPQDILLVLPRIN